MSGYLRVSARPYSRLYPALTLTDLFTGAVSERLAASIWSPIPPPPKRGRIAAERGRAPLRAGRASEPLDGP